MHEQIIILFFIILFTGTTLFLYLWKAKKEVDYKKDERWQTIQLKANHVANYSNHILIVLLAIGTTISLFSDMQTTFTFNRILLFGILFVGFRNMLELITLKYFDKQL